MKLERLYAELAAAAQRTQRDHGADLRGGARIAVRVDGDQITLTLMRKVKALGDTELITFTRACAVPPDALRYPPDGQRIRELGGERWYFVAYRWILEESHALS